MGSLKFWCLISVFLIVSLITFFALLAFPTVLWAPEKLYDNFRIDLRREKTEDMKNTHWGYGILARLHKLLPKNWGKKYTECDGNLQSPVDFNTSAVVNNSLLTPMEYYFYDSRSRNDLWNVTNNGHTVLFSADFANRPFVSRGGLIDGRYYFRQFHFHWGINNSIGSEHTVDGKHFPLEIHLVHTRNPEDKTPYQIAVLGIFFEVISSTDDDDTVNLGPETRQLFEVVEKVREPKTEQIRLPGFTLANFLPSGNQYFRYFGSLTTPPCSQFLQWTVLKTPLKISSDKLAALRSLLAHHIPHSGERSHSDSDDDVYIHENYRPVQTVNGRVINYFTG